MEINNQGKRVPRQRHQIQHESGRKRQVRHALPTSVKLTFHYSHLSQTGFTLLEMLVTLAILVVLVLMISPMMTGFVKVSKKESANAIAATIYTIADNLLYDDIFVTQANKYHCKDGCIIDSRSQDHRHTLLIQKVKQDYPDDTGSYILFYQPSSGVQVQYFYAKNTSHQQPDGSYPETAGDHPQQSSTITTHTTPPKGTYPSVPIDPPTTTLPTTSTAQTTTTTSSTTSVTTTPVTTTVTTTTKRTVVYDGLKNIISFNIWFQMMNISKGDHVVYDGVTYQLLSNPIIFIGLPPSDSSWRRL